jgi:hypothetical protein
MIQKSNRLYEYPPIIERLCSKTSYYNFNIIETEKSFEGSDELYLNYDYEQILIENPVTREKILQGMGEVGLNSEEYINMINLDCDNLGL